MLPLSIVRVDIRHGETRDRRSSEEGNGEEAVAAAAAAAGLEGGAAGAAGARRGSGATADGVSSSAVSAALASLWRTSAGSVLPSPARRRRCSHTGFRRGGGVAGASGLSPVTIAEQQHAERSANMRARDGSSSPGSGSGGEETGAPASGGGAEGEHMPLVGILLEKAVYPLLLVAL